jgi:HSP20 family protein
MANIVPFDPFAEMRALQKQFFGENIFSGGGQNALSLPTTDVYTEDDNQLVVEAHIPHFDENDISVTTDKGVLEIQAEKHEKEADKKKKYVVRESSSSFYRRIKLPEQADEDKIEAHIENGVLRVVIPFKKLPAPKKITISGKSKATS